MQWIFLLASILPGIRSQEESEKEENEEEEYFKNPFRVKVNAVVEHYMWTITSTFITLYTLFFDDIRIISMTLEVDDYFYSITILFMLFFTVEIALFSYS